MSYHIYHTEALILSHTNTGESNRYYKLFTKDLGLVGASAQGVRHLRSKLRYSLQTLSYAHANLVRGKNTWRIVRAESISAFDSLKKAPQKRAIIARVSGLLARFLHGEGRNKELFDEMMSASAFLESNDFTKDELDAVEIILVMRILNDLGYWGRHEKLERFTAGGIWDREIVGELKSKKSEALKTINSAIKETQL